MLTDFFMSIRKIHAICAIWCHLWIKKVKLTEGQPRGILAPRIRTGQAPPKPYEFSGFTALNTYMRARI
jgi:hypothetical protein